MQPQEEIEQLMARQEAPETMVKQEIREYPNATFSDDSKS